MDFWVALAEIVVVLVVAIAFGVVATRLRQDAILGYLAAGVLLGRGGLQVIENRALVEGAAELGVALLLFTIGLEFSWSRLRQMGRIALGGGSLQILATTGLTFVVLAVAGIGWRMALVAGVMVALSSTAGVLRVLGQRAEMDSIHGRNSLGILLMQDAAVIPLMLVVTMLGAGDTLQASLAVLGRAVGLGGALVVAFLLASRHILPRLFHLAAGGETRELPVLLAMVTAVGSAWVAHALQLSPVLGAFVAGVLLGESPFALQIRADIAPLRTVLVTLFFVSIGMVADPSWALANAGMLALAVAAVVVGKSLVTWGVVRALGTPHRHAAATGLCLAQVGEFSFVLAGLARADGLLPEEPYMLAVSVTVTTLFLSPYQVIGAQGLGRLAERLLSRRGSAGQAEPEASSPPHADHVVVVGCGPAGRAVVRAIEDMGVSTVVVDLNPRAVVAARERGLHAYLGDAASEVLAEELHIPSARAVVVTVPDGRTGVTVVQKVRAVAPTVPVLTRARYHVWVQALEAAGSEVVVDEEHEVGRYLGNQVRELLQRGCVTCDEER